VMGFKELLNRCKTDKRNNKYATMSNLSEITVAILAGGLGTRLRSVVSDKPKVLAKINNRPFLTILLDQLVAAGAKKTVLCVGT